MSARSCTSLCVRKPAELLRQLQWPSGRLDAPQFRRFSMFCISKAVSISALALLVCSARAQVSGTWAATGSMAFARANFTATLLQNGRVLVTGGGNLSGGLSSAELYDQLTGTWTSTGSMHLPRISHAAVLLPNGKVLVAGGCNADCGTAATAAA